MSAVFNAYLQEALQAYKDLCHFGGGNPTLQGYLNTYKEGDSGCDAAQVRSIFLADVTRLIKVNDLMEAQFEIDLQRQRA